jgi:hypothetical protein
MQQASLSLLSLSELLPGIPSTWSSSLQYLSLSLSLSLPLFLFLSLAHSLARSLARSLTRSLILCPSLSWDPETFVIASLLKSPRLGHHGREGEEARGGGTSHEARRLQGVAR